MSRKPHKSSKILGRARLLDVLGHIYGLKQAIAKIMLKKDFLGIYLEIYWLNFLSNLLAIYLAIYWQ